MKKKQPPGEDRPQAGAWKPRPRESCWSEFPEESLAWYWKLLGYGGRALIYALGVCYAALAIAAMVYYVIAFARFVLH
ncbi:hypothetical protein P4H70_07800 [Paenibacillus ehimensis]|uniref:hypothetical protein n=1 Tax=Paenibacillus ehimensis TaxID=79264 RepID=UPI002DBA8723|nr:hypothetical protein [Paenibacillus ehimensis]MEC0208850.1 hypothetical protein [Paenibacillus ehimensis]